MKRFLVLLLLEDTNDKWNEDDVARYVGQCEEDFVVAVKEVNEKQWKALKKIIGKTVKNKGKEIWKVLDLA